MFQSAMRNILHVCKLIYSFKFHPLSVYQNKWLYQQSLSFSKLLSMRRKKQHENTSSSINLGKHINISKMNGFKKCFTTLLTGPFHVVFFVRNVPPLRAYLQGHTKCGCVVSKTGEVQSSFYTRIAGGSLHFRHI